MFSSFKKLFYTCSLYSFSFMSCGSIALSQGRSNNEKLKNIEEIKIVGDRENITIIPSNNDETIVESMEDEFDFTVNENSLIVQERMPSFWQSFHFFSYKTTRKPPVNLKINIAPSVHFLSLSNNRSSLDIKDCHIETINIEVEKVNLNIKNVVGNIFFKTSRILGKIEDLFGNISLNTHRCTLDYVIRNKKSTPNSIDLFPNSKINLRLFLCRSFQSIKAIGIGFTESFLPVSNREEDEEGDIIFRGQCRRHSNVVVKPVEDFLIDNAI